MPSTTLRNRNAAPISPAFADFAVTNIHLRRFSLHAAHVIASCIEDFHGWPGTHPQTAPTSWKRTPILYLLDCPHFLEGASELYRVAKEMLGDGDVTHELNDVIELMLEAAEDQWVASEYTYLAAWRESIPNWSDKERVHFLDLLIPNGTV